MGEEPPPEEETAEASPIEHLTTARESLTQYLTNEADDVDKAKAAAALKLIQDLFAKAQTEEEAASGTTPALKGMRRALSA